MPEGGNQGTRLFTAMEQALAEIPRARLAGVIALTDGQVHDVPGASPIEAPFHALLPGRARRGGPAAAGHRGAGLRHRRPQRANCASRSTTSACPQSFPAAGGGAARLSIRRDGAAARIESVPVGREHRIEIPIERGGPTVVELAAEARPGEVSDLNNRAVVTITGVRDRLRVLLVSGEPHAGERTWRRLLKADPGVDLVHFTILRPPEKDDLTPLNELALIAFPVRELFQVKLREFDLVVFDRFANRGILPPAYLRNIADYVRGGGALLMSVGPEFAGPVSLAATPLGAVLPARPIAGAGSSGAAEGAFRPMVTTLGARHPVTEGLTGANPDEQHEAKWGRWYRSMRADQRSGTAVMEAAGGAPLLVLDRVGEGRVALLLSDHIWLWSRGHDGGGPQAELLRRAAHWLMREPELEEEDLTARIEAGRLQVQRRSVEAAPPPEVTVTAPDGSTSRAPAAARPRRPRRGGAGGQPARRLAGLGRPPQRLRGRGRRQPAGGRRPPRRPGPAGADHGGDRRRGALARHRGGAGAAGAAPRRPGRDAQGGGWIGLRRNGDHTVTGIAAMPLLPPWLALPLVLGVAVLAWRREGR